MLKSIYFLIIAQALYGDPGVKVDFSKVPEPIELPNGLLPEIKAMDFLSLVKKRMMELDAVIKKLHQLTDNNRDAQLKSPVKDYIEEIHKSDLKLKALGKKYPSLHTPRDRDIMVIDIIKLKEKIELLSQNIEKIDILELIK